MSVLCLALLIYSAYSFAQDIHWERVIIVRKIEAKSVNSFNSVSVRININTANKHDLEKLIGIGTKKAEAIIHYRQMHGAFKNWDDLHQIKGLSKKNLDKILEKNKETMVLE